MTEAWNRSCDLRADERPKKTASDDADRQTNKQTDGHRDSMTELADSVKSTLGLLVFENIFSIIKI